MDIRQGQPAPRLLQLSHSLRGAFHFLCVASALACLLVLANCASPGEPIERKPPIPEPIGDLGAQQLGTAVSLTFTLPEETVDRRALAQPLTVEIFRDFQPDATSAPKSNGASVPAAAAPHTLLATIPPGTLSSLARQGPLDYIDELRPEDFLQHPNALVFYAVRTRASAKRDSADSNVVSVLIRPLPDPIDDLKAEVTHSGIQLSWTPPTTTPVGAAPPVVSYRIYRSQGQGISPGQSGAATLMKVGESQTANYLDSRNPLRESVRLLGSQRGANRRQGPGIRRFESRCDRCARHVPAGHPARSRGGLCPGPSRRARTSGTFPGISKSKPIWQGITSIAAKSLVFEEHAQFDPLPAPRPDVTSVAGRTYFYTVTAVDRAGNESPASPAVSGTVPAESQTRTKE